MRWQLTTHTTPITASRDETSPKSLSSANQSAIAILLATVAVLTLTLLVKSAGRQPYTLPEGAALSARQHNSQTCMLHQKNHQLIPTQPSVFNTTAAYIRFNSGLVERIPEMLMYEKFFGSITMSFPGSYGRASSSILDSCPYTVAEAHLCVVDFIDRIPRHLTGVLYFHFDFWVYPSMFKDYDLNRVWFVQPGLAPVIANRCFKHTEIPADAAGWWLIGTLKNTTPPAVREATAAYPELVWDPDMMCVGWADMYYLPRSHFAMFQNLARIFHKYEVDQEAAVQLIMRMMINTTKVDYHELPCWGGCCATNPQVEEVKTRLCGHKFDWTNEELKQVYKDKFVELANKDAALYNLPPQGLILN